MSDVNWKNPVIKWVDSRLPIFSMMHHSTAGYPTPKNLNYWWNFGSLALTVLVIMILTGVFLVMNVGPFTWVTLAFYVAFFHPDEWMGAARRLRDRFSA